MSDDNFDGIDLGTTASSLAMAESTPITAESILAACNRIAALGPPAACGSKERPHAFFGEATVGKRVRCVVCQEEMITLKDGRALSLRGLFLGAPPPLRFLAPEPDDQVFAYRSFAFELPRPPVFMNISVGFDDVTWSRRIVLRAMGWRRGKRPIQPRGKRRTDFGRRFVGRPPMVILDDDWL